MNRIEKVLKKITKPLHKKVYQDYKELSGKKLLSEANRSDLSDRLETLGVNPQEKKIVQYRGSIELSEAFLDKRYDTTPKFAYKDKMSHKGRKFSMYPQELITPDAYEIDQFRRSLYGANSWREWYEKIGNAVAKKLTWTSDDDVYGRIDHYEYPAEALAIKTVDCEGHAFLVSSIEPGLAVAYGFYDNGKKRIGHAFNVFVEDDELYVLETTGNKAQIYKYSDQDKYKIHYIFTARKTYVLDDSVKFGRHL